MEYGADIIKEERLYYSDEENNYLEFKCDAKIENEFSYDWCVQDGDVIQTPTNYLSTTSYDELKKDRKQLCFLCCKFFPNSFLLLQHNLKHFNVPLIKRKVFICDYCREFYQTKNELQKHIQTSHKSHLYRDQQTKKKFKCTICNKLMNYHIRFRHMKKKHMFECDHCKKRFKEKQYLKRHILFIHEGIKPSWRFHIIPSGPDIKCANCPAVFKNKYALRTHNRNCHSVTVKCKVCGSTLKSNAYLLTHMRRVHYNDGKVHSCNLCGKTFKSPRYVSIHKRNVHAKK